MGYHRDPVLRPLVTTSKFRMPVDMTRGYLGMCVLVEILSFPAGLGDFGLRVQCFCWFVALMLGCC